MSRLVQALRAIARHEVGLRSYCELGVVSSVFDSDDADDAQSVSVQLKDSGLTLPRVPVATGLTGVGALPRVGDVVLVLFPRGDLGSAVVTSQIYSDKRRPPTFKRDEAALVWPGDADDVDADAIRISVQAGSKRSVTVSLGGDKDASLSISDGEILLQAGGVRIKLAHGSSSDGTVEVSAGGSELRIAQDGDVSVEAAGTLKLKGQKVTIEGDTQVTINGQTVEIN